MAPLKEEIIKLKIQKAKLPGKELQLEQQIEALEHAQRNIREADEQLIQLKVYFHARKWLTGSPT